MTININLLPWRETLKEQQKKEFLSMLGLVVAGAVGLMICIHTLVARQIAFQNDNNTYLKNQIQILDQKIVEIQKIEKEKKELLAKMEVIQQLQASRPEVVQFFDGIVRVVPSGLFLTNLSRTGTKILIDGKAESNTRVSTFMRNIESTSWLRDPQLSLIQADEKVDKGKTQSMMDRLIGFNLQAIEVMTDSKGAEKKDGQDATAKDIPASTPHEPKK